MEAETRFLDIPFSSKPHKMAYCQWQSPLNAETVLCVHGLTRNGRDFDFLARALGQKYAVLAPDMPGRGKSDSLPAPLYNYPTYLFDIQTLLANRALKSVHWIGTSMGGIIGLMMAGAAPGLIKSLVLNDVGCTISAAGLKRIFQYAKTATAFKTRAEAETEIRLRCQPFGVKNELMWRHLFEHGVRELPDGSYSLNYDPAIINGLPLPNPVQDIDLWPLWEAVKSIPVLLIRGANSDLLTEETAKKMQASHSRLTYLEIPNAGHAPALMDDDSIGKIKNWLESL